MKCERHRSAEAARAKVRSARCRTFGRPADADALTAIAAGETANFDFVERLHRLHARARPRLLRAAELDRREFALMDLLVADDLLAGVVVTHGLGLSRVLLGLGGGAIGERRRCDGKSGDNDQYSAHFVTSSIATSLSVSAGPVNRRLRTPKAIFARKRRKTYTVA
jgi:hypothetical protein